MRDPGSHLQDTILRVLDGAPRGLTVERIRSQLVDAGAGVAKDEIVRALARLNDRQLVQFGSARRWQVRQKEPSLPHEASVPSPDSYLVATPCQAVAGVGPDNAGPDISQGEIKPSIALLKQLLPYYHESLRAGDAGSPQAYAGQHGDNFVLLEPDRPWWPTAEQGRTIIIPLTRVPQGLRGLLAKQHSQNVLLGYPLHLVKPRDPASEAFIRPVAAFLCRFEQTETHLRIHVPAVRPTIVRDWLRDQAKYGGWSASRLLSWLLVEDASDVLNTDDEADAPEFLEVPSLASRLASAAGKSMQQDLVPSAVASRVPCHGATGYYNGLAIFPEATGIYVRSAINDYERLCHASDEQLASTALSALFGAPAPSRPAPAILHPFPLGETQLLATRAALAGPLTVITGPPGTGKSQVIASIMISAAAAGCSVLLAARQHRAIDAVQERLEALTGDRVLLIRANESEGFARFTFADALKALQSRAGDAASAHRFNRLFTRVIEHDEQRWARLERWRELRSATEEEAALVSKLESLAFERAKLAGSRDESGQSFRRPGLVARLISFLLRQLGRTEKTRGLLGNAFRHTAFDREEARLKSALRAAEDRIRKLRADLESATETPVTLGETIQSQSADLMEPLLDRLDSVAPQDRQALAAASGDAQLMGRQNLDARAYQLILRHMPLWAVTTLAAGSRIPLEAALFDYVVFDEAAVTDIASATPLLYRAKSAVIVGDPMQLGMISNIDPREERRMLGHHGLLRSGIGRFAQGQTDLFQLAASALHGEPFLLNEHFRCHPDIAAYFNEAFYGRRLQALTNTGRLNVPRGFKPGLHWTDVQGAVATGREIGMGGSAYSEAEAGSVVAELKVLLESEFKGTVGVVTFFAPQAKRINEMVAKEIGAAGLDALNVKVFTANKFQGDERDVMLVSLCLAPGMPSGARNFLMRERRLLNVAVSRARAVCHVFGDRRYAASCGIPHIETLVRKVAAGGAKDGRSADDRFESPWEKQLYDALVARGLAPIPQHPVAGRFLDLALVNESRSPPVRVDIEVDGWAFHTDADGNRLTTDLWRDHQLSALGWKVLRFWVYELRDDMEACLERIDHAIRE